MDNQIFLRSLNCRGLRDDDTRNKMLFWCKQKVRGRTPSINILSETHCHERKDRTNWGRQWSLNEENSFWSLGTKHSKGVAILISDEFRQNHPDMKILNTCIDSNGRYIKLIISINNSLFRILGVYAPNDGYERVKFLHMIKDLINDGYDAENLFGGDWNLAFSSELDRFNCVGSNDLGKKDLSLICDSLDIEDIWRRRNPQKVVFSWSGRGKQSRIDFWLTSLSLSSQIKSVSYSFAPYTDHSSVNLILDIEETKRGPGIWKMNCNTLLDKTYQQELTKMWGKWQSKKGEYQDIKRWWDLGKRHIKSFSIDFSKEMALKTRSQLSDIEEKIDLRKKANADYERLQKQYEDIFSIKCNGARVRSRIEEWEEGEKSTKYFYGLEKSRAKEKSWTEILDKHGNLIRGTVEIQKRQVEFYEDLFKSQEKDEAEKSSDFFFSDENSDCQISEANKEMLDSDISDAEFFKNLKKMKNNKSPGPDGIITEFYKLFWNVIGHDLCDVLRAGLEDEQLAYTQYLAVITLLYKKGPRSDIKNWRPISLLNNDYKLVSKVLAERLKVVLPEIIHPDQKGCVPGRYIGENIRLIDDILHEIEEGNMPASILQLDQEKAFDRVEWRWLFKCLEKFNFGHKFIGYLKTMYKDSKSSVLTNGYQSRYFSITRGIRQGDSLSALLFIIQFEPLMSKIRNDSSIKGIKLDLKNCNSSIDVKGCQYVDDSNSFLMDDESIKNFFKVIEKFELASGSKVNISKTVCLMPNKKAREKTESNLSSLKLKIKAGPEKVLGVLLGKCPNNSKDFWDQKIDKMNSKLKVWRMRNLSYEGKVLLIRSLALSQVMYAIEMKTIDESHIKRINDIIFEFLWSGKSIRIKREICSLPKTMGGLNVVNLRSLIKVKRVQWILRFLKEGSGQNWAKLTENYIRCLDNRFDIEFFSLKVTDSTDLIEKSRIPLFYKECIKFYQELLRIGKVRDNNEILWNNNQYLFNGKPLSFPHWSKSGIKTVSDLYKDSKIDIFYLLRKISIKCAFIFEIAKLKRAFPTRAHVDFAPNNVLYGGKDVLLQTKINVPNIGIKCLNELTSRDLYSIFNLSDIPVIPSHHYWNNKFDNDHIDWKIWYEVNTINKYIPRPCKSFNFRILHGQVNTESRLRYMKHSNGQPFSDGKCKICHPSGFDENLDHVLYFCQNSRRIWHGIQILLNKFSNRNIVVDNIIATTGFWQDGISNDILLINVICSIVRFHLWKVRCKIRHGEEDIDFNRSIRLLMISLHNHMDNLLSSKSNDRTFQVMVQDLKELFKDLHF